MSNSSYPNQKLSAVMSGLMGIVFGCSIVYIISRLVAAQRRIAALETHIIRKADDDVVVSLSSKVNDMNLMCEETKVAVSTISSAVKRTLSDIPSSGGSCVSDIPSSERDESVVSSVPLAVVEDDDEKKEEPKE